ncbi:hypothetical protein [Agrococcus baldri]|uniref:Uncharacterized protein n=1 Tax=Agrococcus baldri TaxID=153730 RepID=A0AA87REV1_9MICO|nr:hypothetical protein [Agrococcus baldri]GEK81396.1 hypothetical protein ABA31_27470 [Agrococcus baldri]
MSWHQHGPDPDERKTDPEGEYLEHYEVPEGSGSASSFATRHNEFPPGEGHDGAAHDPATGEAVHGDGTPNEALPAQWDEGEASGQDPAAHEVESGEDDYSEVEARKTDSREDHP